MLYRILADLVLLFHFLFILFVIFGGFLLFWKRRLIWIHLPSAVWGALIEFQGWICPLTPLENMFRHTGGQAGYEGGFIENYLVPVIYPSGLTREIQIILGIITIGINVIVYASFFFRSREANPKENHTG